MEWGGFWQVAKQKKFLLGELWGLHFEEERSLSDVEKLRKDLVITYQKKKEKKKDLVIRGLERITLMEEVSWRQKSRVL
jgi:hypothetical protein